MGDIVVIWNDETSPPGRLVSAMEKAGVSWRDVRAEQGEDLPDLDGAAAVVLLGGYMAAYEEDQYPWLAAEKAFARRAVERDVPVLGICLGAQLLADALGGQVFKADKPEVGVVELSFTPEGRADPVVGPLPPKVFAFHQDTFDVPPGSQLLARSDRFPHIFRFGSALALQFHPETPTDLALSWGEEAATSILEPAGLTVDEYAAMVRASDRDLEVAAEGLFSRWLSSLRR